MVPNAIAVSYKQEHSTDMNTSMFSIEQARNGGDATTTVRPLKQGSKA